MIVGFEHALLIIKWIVNWAIPDVPSHILNDIEDNKIINERVITKLMTKEKMQEERMAKIRQDHSSHQKERGNKNSTEHNDISKEELLLADSSPSKKNN